MKAVHCSCACAPRPDFFFLHRFDWSIECWACILYSLWKSSIKQSIRLILWYKLTLGIPHFSIPHKSPHQTPISVPPRPPPSIRPHYPHPPSAILSTYHHLLPQPTRSHLMVSHSFPCRLWEFPALESRGLAYGKKREGKGEEPRSHRSLPLHFRLRWTKKTKISWMQYTQKPLEVKRERERD